MRMVEWMGDEDGRWMAQWMGDGDGMMWMATAVPGHPYGYLHPNVSSLTKKK